MTDDDSQTSGRLGLAELNDMQRVSLCEALDRVLNKGAVVAGEVIISVAGIDLVYLGLQLVLTSVETARSSGGPGGAGLTLEIGKERGDAVTRNCER
jgi:hypothetical protein